ncbi:MAG: DNA translocase FtsK 4TM domain-containing protein, partial [Patescibacteria group bacterium]
MAKDSNSKKENNSKIKDKKSNPVLSSWTKRWIKAILMFLVAVVVGLSFWNKAGVSGRIFINVSKFLVGQVVFTLPLFFFLGGLIFLRSRKKGKTLAMFLAITVTLLGISGILASQDLTKMQGGWTGFLMAKLFVGGFGLLAANIIFSAIILIGFFIFLQFIRNEIPKEKLEEEKRPSFMSQILRKREGTSFKIKGTEDEKSETSVPLSPRISLFKKEKLEDTKEKKP